MLFKPPVPRLHDDLPGPSAAGPIPADTTAPAQHSPAYGIGPERVQLLPAARAAEPPPPADLSNHSSLLFFGARLAHDNTKQPFQTRTVSNDNPI